MAEENKQNTPQEILTIPVAILVLSIVIAGYLIWTGLVPAVQGCINAQKNSKELLNKQSQLEQQLETLKTTKAPNINYAYI